MLDESLIQIKFPTLQKQRGTMQHVAIKGSKLRAKRPDNVARKMSDKFVAGPFDLGLKQHFILLVNSQLPTEKAQLTCKRKTDPLIKYHLTELSNHTK